jgi:hypothetical protein
MSHYSSKRKVSKTPLHHLNNIKNYINPHDPLQTKTLWKNIHISKHVIIAGVTFIVCVIVIISVIAGVGLFNSNSSNNTLQKVYPVSSSTGSNNPTSMMHPVNSSSSSSSSTGVGSVLSSSSTAISSSSTRNLISSTSSAGTLSSNPISSSSSTGRSSSSSSSTGISSIGISSSSSMGGLPTAFVIVGVGGGNAKGAGTPVDTYGLDAALSTVQQYTIGDQYSQNVTISDQIVPAMEPLNDGFQNSNGPLVRLGNKFAAATGSNILILDAGLISSPMSQWTTTASTRAYNAMQNISTLVVPKVLMFAWIHGESDQGSSPSAYQTNLINVINNLRTNMIGANSTTPFVLLGFLPEWTTLVGTPASTILDVIRAIPSIVPYTAYRLPPMGVSDCTYLPIYYSSTGLRINGQLNYYAYYDALANTAAGLVLSHPTSVSMTLAAGAYNLAWSTVSGATNYMLIYRRYVPFVNVNGICGDIDDTVPSRLLLNTTTGAITLPNGFFTPSTLYQFDVSSMNGNQPSSQRTWSTFNSNPSTNVYPSNLMAYVPLQSHGFYDNVNNSYAATEVSGVYLLDPVNDGIRFTLGTMYTSLIPPPVGTLCMRWSVNELLLGVFGRAIYGTIARADLSSGSKYLGVSPSGIYAMFGTTNVVTGPPVLIQTIYHTCLTYTSTTAEIYLNGVLVQSQSITGITNPTSNDAISIGGQYARANPWNGLFSCMTVWNTVLDAPSVLALYNAGSACM